MRDAYLQCNRDNGGNWVAPDPLASCSVGVLATHHALFLTWYRVVQWIAQAPVLVIVGHNVWAHTATVVIKRRLLPVVAVPGALTQTCAG